MSNDEKNLYVKIDLTLDNTMDDKDYAKVYINTGAGIKEFKVSVHDTKWGKPDFTYTDKVTYQHKVYDFAIPLKEVGIEDVRKADEIQLAFAAYGTGSPPGGSFNPSSGNYLVVYERSGDIYGWLVDSNGNNIGTEIAISTAADYPYLPSVAYNSRENQYLVVWSDNRSGNSDIYGQYLTNTGVLIGDNFLIVNNAGIPHVVANTNIGNYLIAYPGRDGYAWVIVGERRPAATAVPTLNEWGMIIFMVLSILGSVYYIRRQRV